MVCVACNARSHLVLAVALPKNDMTASSPKLLNRIRGFLERNNRLIVAAAIICLAVGAALSHVIEPGVRVEKIMLTTNIPALRIFPATPGPHPKALLAHGGGGSKEMLFRFGEAFAAAGFDCYSLDQAGQGESPLPFSITNLLLNIQDSDRALGGVDVFIGHSL